MLWRRSKGTSRSRSGADQSGKRPDKVVVGLGNPGSQYSASRHNLGFRLIDALARRHRLKVEHEAFQALTGGGRIEGRRVLFIKPLTYMNRSGLAVERAVRRYGLEASDILVIHDDVDLDFGRIRIRSRGGDGGHRGVGSVIDALGDEDFVRLRIGIGRPRDDITVEEFVLSPFEDEEEGLLAGVLHRGVGAVEAIIRDGAAVAMNTFN